MSADANADAMAPSGTTPVTEPAAPTAADATVAADALPAGDAGTATQRPAAASGTARDEGSLAAPSVAAASAAAASTPAKPARRFETTTLVIGRRLLRLVLALSLFGAGVYLGWRTFADSQPVTEVVGDPAVVGNPTPAIVAELANAIAADDADAIRAALTPEIFSSYTADLQNFRIVRVESVETLGTYVDDNRTATALVIHGRDADKNALNVNLVVITEDGQIVRLR